MHRHKFASSPVWGMWIEILDPHPPNDPRIESSPVWGMWIEIAWLAKFRSDVPVIPRVGDVD